MWVIHAFFSALINEEYGIYARSISLILVCSMAKVGDLTNIKLYII